MTGKKRSDGVGLEHEIVSSTPVVGHLHVPHFADGLVSHVSPISDGEEKKVMSAQVDGILSPLGYYSCVEPFLHLMSAKAAARGEIWSHAWQVLVLSGTGEPSQVAC
jgi:hypothetical protein